MGYDAIVHPHDYCPKLLVFMVATEFKLAKVIFFLVKLRPKSGNFRSAPLYLLSKTHMGFSPLSQILFQKNKGFLPFKS
jgi:hypothetical protein